MISEREAQQIAASMLGVDADRLAAHDYEGYWMVTFAAVGGQRPLGGTAIVVRSDGEARRTSASLPPQRRIQRAFGDE